MLFFFLSVISNELFQEVQKILDDKTLEEHLYLLDIPDGEIDLDAILDTPPPSRTSPVAKKTPRTSKLSKSSSNSSSDSDSDSSSDSDSDSSDSDSSSSTDSDDEEVTPQTSTTQETTTEIQPPKPEEDDDDIIILEYDNMEDQNKGTSNIGEPEPASFHVSCYISRDTTKARDLFSYTQISTFTTMGDTRSHLDKNHYINIIKQAKRNILATTPLNSILKDGVKIQLHVPEVYYATPNGDKTRVPLPLTPVNMVDLPTPKYYVTYGEKHGLVSVYFLMILDYYPIVEKELQRRRQEDHKTKMELKRKALTTNSSNSNKRAFLDRFKGHNKPEVHQLEHEPSTQLSRKRPHNLTVSNENGTHQPQVWNESNGPDSKPKQPRLETLITPTRTQTPAHTRTILSYKPRCHKEPRRMTTLHQRSQIFSRLGPAQRKNEVTPTSSDRYHQRQKKSKLRRQQQRQQAAMERYNY